MFTQQVEKSIYVEIEEESKLTFRADRKVRRFRFEGINSLGKTELVSTSF